MPTIPPWRTVGPPATRREDWGAAWTPIRRSEHPMDGSRFDSLARAMAAPTTRRRALRTLLGAMAAGFAASARQVSAQDTDADAARKGPYWRAGKRCVTDDR